MYNILEENKEKLNKTISDLNNDILRQEKDIFSLNT